MLPNFFVVGAAKSGTSSLDRYLSQHPDIFIPPKKEAHFYSIPDFPAHFEGPGDEGMNLYTIRDRGTYELMFRDFDNKTAIGESSVFYLYYPGTAQRMKADVPDARIIIVLRNPVDRAFSAYMHLVRDEREKESFAKGLELEEQRKAMAYEPMWLYREVGLYARQIKRFMDVFSPEQVKVIVFEEFTKNPATALKDIFKFLEVSPDFDVDTSLRHNVSGKPSSRWAYNFISKPNPLKEVVKPFIPPSLREKLGLRAKSMVLKKVDMDPQQRAYLADYFAADIADLEDLLKRRLSAWHSRGALKV